MPGKDIVTAHLTSDELEGYLSGACPAEALLRLDDHLAACEACRRHLDTAGRISTGIEELRESLSVESVSVEHPTMDEIAAYVDGAADDVERETIEAHLEICRTCAEDVQDLRIVQIPKLNVVPMSGPRRKWYVVAAVGAAAAGLAGMLIWNGGNVSNRLPQSTPSPVATAPAALAILRDGAGTVTLDASGSLTGIPALAPDDRDLIVAALGTGRTDIPPFVAELRGRDAKLLGTPGAAPPFRPLRPMATAVENTRPVFEWTAVNNATAYVVSVFDTNLEKVAESEQLSGLQWMPSQPLARGRAYIWQVRVRTPPGDVIAPAPPAHEARFLVLAQTEADRVAAVRQRYAASPLALGILLAHAGLVEDAGRYLRELAAANPSSPEAKELFANIDQEPSPITTKPAQ